MLTVFILMFTALVVAAPDRHVHLGAAAGEARRAALDHHSFFF
jgi:hypothetical protein